MRLTGAPSGEIRNFSKFQEISVLLTGFQMKNFGSAIKSSVLSLGAGRLFFNHLKSGCSFSPFTSILSNMIAFGWKRQNDEVIRVLLAELIHLREVSDSCSS